EAGHRVRTLTNTRPDADPHGGKVEIRPLDFDDYEGLVDALRGAAVFYNTYWVRFNAENFTLAGALENSRQLFAAAGEAGVERLVHISITNPSQDSSLEYFRDKAILEKDLADSGISHAVLRPAVMFGQRGILINNIAWMLRRFPSFGVFGDGRYRLQPIHVDDVARLAVQQGVESGRSHHQRHRPGDLHLPGTGRNDRPGDRQEAADHPGPQTHRLLFHPADGKTGRRRHPYPRRNRRAHGRTALRGRRAGRHHPPEPLG
ncbi:MAG: hypothetical protein GWO11_06080, partial [Desulfuromonadales bacterium]|nr:hypothetical protein [Desulfuromonadales bacterium]NIS42629.1 hypothetical protein [Desulfuromonadales bacterium]